MAVTAILNQINLPYSPRHPQQIEIARSWSGLEARAFHLVPVSSEIDDNNPRHNFYNTFSSLANVCAGVSWLPFAGL